MITHPFFWPKYWGYESEEWYKYNEEIFIENEFSISFEKEMGKTTYIHRPLSHRPILSGTDDNDLYAAPVDCRVLFEQMIGVLESNYDNPTHRARDEPEEK